MNIIKFITSTAKASVPVIKAHSPKILLVAGLIGIAGGTVWACYNTATKLAPLADKHTEAMDRIGKLKEEGHISEEEAGKSATSEKTNYIFGIVKVYVGPAALLGLSAASICVSHHIIQARYLGACAALQSVTEAYSKFKEKAYSELGEEKIAQLEKELAEEKAKNEENALVNADNAKLADGIVRHFNLYSAPNLFKRYQPYNYDFLRNVQAQANRRLNASSNGILFANDVIEMFGGEKTELGCYFGWCREDGDVIDLGLDTPHNNDILVKQINDERADWILTLNACRCVSVMLESTEMKYPYNKAVAELRNVMHRDGVVTEDWALENK